MGGIYQAPREPFILKIDVLEAGMGNRKELSEFDKDHIVMATRMGHIKNYSSCRLFLVWSGHYLSKVDQGRNSGELSIGSRHIDACGEWRLACLVQSNRHATDAQIAEKVNAGSDRKVSQPTVHRSLLHGRKPVMVPILTPVHHWLCQQWACEHQNWTMEQ